jgi:protein-S-isoprenylcysteine O-methyltransferase Ste14
VTGAARGPAPAHSTGNLALKTLLGWLWFALWFFAVFPAGVLLAAGRDLRPPLGGKALPGAALIALALAALVAPHVRFVREGRGTQLPFDPPRELVVRGAHAWVRNPMYLLYGAIVLGEALLYRSWALLGYALFFAALCHFYVVRFEERDLRRRFGAPYEAYRARVPRWLPRRPPRAEVLSDDGAGGA